MQKNLRKQLFKTLFGTILYAAFKGINYQDLLFKGTDSLSHVTMLVKILIHRMGAAQSLACSLRTGYASDTLNTNPISKKVKVITSPSDPDVNGCFVIRAYLK